MLDWLMSFVSKFGSKIVSLLPHSPFQSVIKTISDIPYLSWLNWFLPISDFIAIGILWLAAIASYYLWIILMRWIKVIGD